jgi:hypothetical protein
LIQIYLEDRHKTTFATKWGSYQYTVMPFGMNNTQTIFSRVIIAVFKDFIHKFLEVYLDDLIVFSLLKDHVEFLRLMLYQVQEMSDLIKHQEMYFWYTFWNIVGTYSV